jgi:serine protease AprX
LAQRNMATKLADLRRPGVVFHWVTLLLATIVLLSVASVAIPSVSARGISCWIDRPEHQYRIGEDVTIFIRPIFPGVVGGPEAGGWLTVYKPDGSEETRKGLAELLSSSPQPPQQANNFTVRADVRAEPPPGEHRAEFFGGDGLLLADCGFFTVTAVPIDLEVTRLWVNPSNPHQGDMVSFSAEVANIGGTDANGFLVEVYLDSDFWQSGYFSLPAGKSGTITWNRQYQAEDGSHEVRWVVNSDRRVEESNYFNNEGSTNFFVNPGTVILTKTETQTTTITEATTIVSTRERTTTETMTERRTETMTVTSTACFLPVPPTYCPAVMILLVLVLLILVVLVEVRRPARKPPTPPTAPPAAPPPPHMPPSTPPVTPPAATSRRPAGVVMAKKRIIAHFMNEEERLAALEKMTQVDQTESFLVGEIDEGDIPELQRQGLVVQASEDWAKAETPGGESEPLPGVRRLQLRVGPPRVAPLAVDLTKPNFYLIALRGPLLEDWRNKLEQLGVRLLEYMPRNSYTAKLTPRGVSSGQINDIVALPFVSGVRLYGAEDTGPVALMRANAPLPAGGPAMIAYDVRLHQEEDLGAVLQWLKTHGVSTAGAQGRKIRLYLLSDSPLADELAALPEVASVEEYVPPRLLNNVARMLLGIDRQSGPSPVTELPQTGQGQIVAVADTGLDDKHPDFQGRIVGIVALGRSNDYSDPHGHGTHVAGSVLGDGAASKGVIRGAAPKAKLFFQSLLSADGGLGGLPLILGDLFEEAYQAGARIHNNSWGSATRSMYTINSVEVDEFVAKRRDMLIVIAAGNEGQAANCLHSQPGCVDWLSIGSPGSCKNALTVGASRSSRTSGGFATLSYGQAWPDGFPNPPVASETVSGNPEGIAAFSSRGPCDDRRIKPEVVVPGTDIASTKSSRAPLRNFWGPYPENPMYAFMGGTSMAAPLVAGCAALVREYYVSNRNHEPSAALLKATLINSTKWLTGADAVADHPCAPNYHQGFGCIWMPWAIPNSSSPSLKLEFIDTWKDPQKHLVRTGQRFRFQISISGGNWLRICLAYTDIAARALQNNLDLFVQHMQSRQKWIGNADLPSGLKIPDPDNNVEVVRLEKPPVGDYLLQITATNLLQAGQDFALVVTGELTSPIVQV